MSGPSVLKFGLVGYVYRGLRDGGFVAIATGVWVLAGTLIPAINDGRVDATVIDIEAGCAFNRDLGDVTGLTGAKPDCSTPAMIQTGLVSEVPVAKLSFAARPGEIYRSEIRLDDLNRPDLTRGDVVEIAYNRDNPAIVRAVPAFAEYLEGLGLIAAGILMFAVVWLARRAADYRGDVDAEVAELERAHRARTQRS
jgi:hypothetical protein